MSVVVEEVVNYRGRDVSGGMDGDFARLQSFNSDTVE